jgi:hypothetical protein
MLSKREKQIALYEATNKETQTFMDGLQPTALESEKFPFDKHWAFCFKRGLSQFLHDRTKDVSCSIINNEVLANLYIKASGKTAHGSDCATSVAPAETPGPCDCDVVAPPLSGARRDEHEH